MTGAALLTLLVIAAVLLGMMTERAPPDVLLVGGVVLLTSVGIIGPKEAFGGFANTGMLTVAALFVVSAGLRETGAVALLTARLLGRPSSERAAIGRLVGPVIFASAFLNNTTIVATLLPAVHDWARRIGVAPSRLLMPLSFAAILGGTCTLIGTSTNLVVVGLVEDMAADHAGLRPLSMFEITPIGLLVAAAGAACLVALTPWVLPDRRPPISTDDDPRSFTMELMVPAHSRAVGKTVEEAGLRHLPGATLAHVLRDAGVLEVDPRLALSAGDRLVFAGDVDAVVELQRHPDLVVAPDEVYQLGGQRQHRQIVEAVIASSHPLVGTSIKDGAFRQRYNAVILAVARAGERLRGRIGDIVLRPGDVLLLEAHPDFTNQQRNRSDFTLVSSVHGATPPRYERAWVAGAILAALVTVTSFELVPTVNAAFLGAAAMLLTRCCTIDEARRSLDLTVLVAIAAAFGLGEAMRATGLDQAIADLAFRAGADSPMAGLIALYVVTTLLTEVVTNNAAAVLTVPIAVAMAERLGVAPMGYVVAVMFAASASFLSPIGYQTNLMVYTAGGYRAFDYPRLGLPLSVIVGVTTVALVPIFWPF